MKKLPVLLMIVCLLSSCAFADELIAPDVEWSFPVPLGAFQSKFGVFVNEDHLLDKSFTPAPLVKVQNVKRATNAAVFLEQTACEALCKMFEAAAQVQEYTYVDESGNQKVAKYGEKGMTLYLKSGYRSYDTQATTYANYLARNNNVDDGYVAKPGTSEHQTGICADILNADYASRPRMTQDFKWTPEAQWMKENCAEFGFILRYTEEGEAKTGIKFEPWHFRYVGKDMASYIMSRDLTMEEFMAEYEAALDEFMAAGGNVKEWVAYEDRKRNSPPASYVLEETDESGDAEVSLIY